MIDIKLLRAEPDTFKNAAKNKGYDIDIDALLRLDEQKRALLAEVDELRQRRNEIASAMKGGKPDQTLVDEGKQLKIKLAEQETYLNNTEAELHGLISAIPNPAFSDVPVGGEEDSVEIRTFGDKKAEAKDHLDFALAKDWVDFERGAKVAGSKFYFLKGDLALLENALIQYVLSEVTKHEFKLVTVPHMVNARTATGTGFAPRTSDQSDEYYIEGEDLSLIATAEMPLTGFHADELIDEATLPLKYAALSPCYRKEAGTYGKHTRGLFRVHQFNKLEMYAFCTPEQSQKLHEEILAIEEKIYQALGIPYRIINIATGDLGAPAAKKYDIEYWSSVDNKYREITSCSNCTDYQTRNLNIRFRRSDGTIDYAHSLNGTAVSTARALIAILENYQDGDDLVVPEVLVEYMNGREKI
jgi:seryl-tRNA synthetase